MAFHNVPPNGFPDIPDIEDLEAVQGDITALKTGKAPKTDIAAEFSATANYAVGDLVYKDGVLYECTTAHEAAAWSADDFTAANVGSAVSSLRSGLTNVQDDVKLNTQDLTTVSRSKNIVPMTLDKLKTQNTLGTWTGNAYEYNGIVWSINTNSAGQVTSITGNGTANGMSLIELWAPYKAGSYIINGAPADTPASGSYYLQFYANHVVDVKERGSGVTATLASDANVVVRPIVPDTVQLSNVTFYPMVRLATESDATFAPYIPSVESRIEAVESVATTVTDRLAEIVGLYAAKVATNNTGQTITFTFRDANITRASGIIFVNANSGTYAISAFGFKSTLKNEITLLAGSSSISIAMDIDTGTITVSGLDKWAAVTVLSVYPYVGTVS